MEKVKKLFSQRNSSASSSDAENNSNLPDDSSQTKTQLNTALIDPLVDLLHTSWSFHDAVNSGTDTQDKIDEENKSNNDEVFINKNTQTFTTQELNKQRRRNITPIFGTPESNYSYKNEDTAYYLHQLSPETMPSSIKWDVVLQ